jgi:hypothetical protein
MLNGNALRPGTPYFVRVSAINSVGRGMFRDATVINEVDGSAPSIRALVPRAPPTKPLNTIVEAVVESSTTMRLYWLAPASNEGARIEYYYVEWDTAATMNSRSGGRPIGNETVRVGEGTPYPQDGPFVHVFPSKAAEPLVAGETYFIRITAWNDQGQGDAAFFFPRCQAPLENCEAEMRPRALPSAPVIVLSAPGNTMEFTNHSLSVSFETPLLGQGGGYMFADKYKVEWDTVSSFDSQNGVPLSFITTRPEILCNTSLSTCLGTSPEVSPLGVQVISATSSVVGGTLANDLQLSYGRVDASSCVSVTAADSAMATHIQAQSALWGVTAVTVVRSGLVSGGYRWTVTFTNPSAPRDVLRVRACSASGVSCSGAPGCAPVLRAEPRPPTYTITPLVQGTTYYVRVTAHNTLGYGAPSLVHSSKPQDEPTRVNVPELSVYDDDDANVGTSLRVTWNAPDDDGGDDITHYRVEWATENWPVYTNWTVQRVITTATSQISGTFSLTMNTTATACGTGSGECPVAGIFTTGQLPFDISAQDLETALQNLPNVDTLAISRTSSGLGAFIWAITFTSQLNNMPALLADATNLYGDSIDIGTCARDATSSVKLSGASTVTCTNPDSQIGGIPVAYNWTEIAVRDLGNAPFEHRIRHLTPGTEYWVRVTARNSRGYGMMKESAPKALHPPYQQPSTPTNPFHPNGPPVFYAIAGDELVVQWAAPVFTGGAPILEYKVEIDTTPDFSSEVSPTTGNHDSAVREFIVKYPDTIRAGMWELRASATRGVTYWARVSALNGRRGYGAPINTYPESVVPVIAPEPPALPTVTVLDTGTSVRLSWARPQSYGSDVSSYRVEWYSMYLDPPFFGVRKVQTVTTQLGGGVLGGQFTLSYGDYLVQLPGTVRATPGSAVLLSTVDLTPHVRRGDRIRIEGVDAIVKQVGGFFDNTRVELEAVYNGPGGPALNVTRRHKTGPIPFNATAADMERYLEDMPTISQVTVEKTYVGYVLPVWTVTFVTDEAYGAPVYLVPNFNLLTGTSPAVVVAETTAGVLPNEYMRVDPAPVDTAMPSFVIENLVPGRRYYARVSAANNRGYGFHSPVAVDALTFVPVGLPGTSGGATLELHTATSLVVRYDETATSGGLVNTKYRVEVGPTASINASAPGYKAVELPVTSKYQKVIVDAKFAPIAGTFTLSFGGFHGDLSRRLAALFNVGYRDSYVIGDADLRADVDHGDYLQVGTEIFRVCNYPNARRVVWSSPNLYIPLCSASNYSADAMFTGIPPNNNLTAQPVFMSDTTLGTASIARGTEVLVTSSSFLGKFTCGDELQIGDTDQLYRTSVSRCASNNATTIFLDRTFRGYDGMNVPVWRRQTTAPLSWDSTAQQVKYALEQLTLVSTVDVTRELFGNGFVWTVTFTTVRTNALLNAGALSPLVANMGTIQSTNPAYLIAYVEVRGTNRVVIDGLPSGVPMYAQVRAFNGRWSTEATTSLPPYLVTVNTPPASPINVDMEPLSNSEILVQWSPPVDSGGEPIIKYEVEWDTLPTFTSPDRLLRTTRVLASAVSPIYDVQSISTSFTDEVGRGGTFSVMFYGQTVRVNWDVQALDMKAALQTLSTVGEVQVTRNRQEHGHTWLITFVSMPYPGDLYNQLFVDGVGLLGNDPTVSVGVRSEAQSFKCTGNPASSTATFTLGFMGTTTVVTAGTTIAQLQQTLNGMYAFGNGIDRVLVQAAGGAQPTVCAASTPASIGIYFIGRRGDVAPLDYTSFTGGVSVVADADTTSTRGIGQITVGRLPYWTILTQIPAGNYYLRVIPQNKVGYTKLVSWQTLLYSVQDLQSTLQLHQNRLITPATTVATPPRNVTAVVASSTAVLVSWVAPITNGGVPITSYEVEYDTVNSFDSKCGAAVEVQTITLSAAEAPTATHSARVCLNSVCTACTPLTTIAGSIAGDIAALSTVVAAGGVSVVVSGDRSAAWNFGYQFNVTFNAPGDQLPFVVDGSCAANSVLSTVVERVRGFGTGALPCSSGELQALGVVRGVSGSATQVVVQELVPGIRYFFRVVAVNSKGSSPSQVATSNPWPLYPYSAPVSPTWATLSVDTPSSLAVFWRPATGFKPEGSRGSPVSSYRVRVVNDTRTYEVQQINVTVSKSTGAITAGSFGLSYNSATVFECLPHDAPAWRVERALEALSSIDDVTVTSRVDSTSATDSSTVTCRQSAWSTRSRRRALPSWRLMARPP